MNQAIKKRLLTIFDFLAEISVAESMPHRSAKGGSLVCAVCLGLNHLDTCVIGQMIRALIPVIPKWADRETWLAQESSQKS